MKRAIFKRNLLVDQTERVTERPSDQTRLSERAWELVREKEMDRQRENKVHQQKKLRSTMDTASAIDDRPVFLAHFLFS